MTDHPPVAILDGGGANIASLRFALERLGRPSRLTTDETIIRDASHVILPGVGAARPAMERLSANGLDRVIPALTQPVLGICLGMQLLFEASEEDETDCLGIIPGTVRRFDPAPGRPVPHMGWNQTRLLHDSPLLEDLPVRCHFYFVHSYAVPVGQHTLASCDYGWEFAAVVGNRNFLATQFHPERSGVAGARLLQNFLTRY
ncbi:MAG: imidazole glycerol phosphate synthase subunit HisH [Gammaproteobacteria bacterium]|nr:MAG: imidazole glycerol phosphate synthase subunit HisH [Gammaproteobacteria bacterium]